MDTTITIITELIGILTGTDLQTDLANAIPVVEQILALLGDKNAERDLQAAAAYKSALVGSTVAAQYLYHNSQPDSGMPHEDIVDGQKYWALLVAAGWSVNGSGLTGTVVPPKA